MSARGAAIYFVLFTLAVTWPGMTPFNRVEPMILGLPFNMVWMAAWVVGGFVVLLLVDRTTERRHRERGRDDRPTAS
jgi:TRAP-type C4-dicarboxylate transport system permease small subunit